tara:strand:+ start:6005 stop:6511 length:507 start_codon:yes stop_codon:yes gene_type:complete
MGLGLFFFKAINREYYKSIPFGLLVLNFIVQRIFGVNREVPFSVNFTSRIKGYQWMKIHKSVWKSLTISNGLYIIAFHEGEISIGKNTIIAPNVVINNGNHDLIDRSIHHVKNISIGNNCWLAANVVILGGTKLGNNVTVAAGSVVNKAFPDNVVIGGVPAKVLKVLN